MFKRLTACSVILLAALSASACFDIEQTLTLERNLSGKAGFRMKIDMSPMAVMMAHMQHAMSGKSGQPSAEDIEKIRKEMMSEAKPMDKKDFEDGRKELQEKLPQGVTLLDATFEDQPLGFGMGMVFGFDHPSKLAKIEFPKDVSAGAALGGPGGGGDSPIDTPFGNLTISEQSGTILIVSKPSNPVADQMPAQGPDKADPEAEKLAKEILKGLRVAYRITAPFTIVEHNAHRREGNTLVWEYNVESFEKLTQAELDKAVMVRYRK